MPMGSLMPEMPEPGSYERNDDVICDTTKVVHRPGGHGVRKGTIVHDGKGCYKLPDDKETGQSPMDQIPLPVPAQHTSSLFFNDWENVFGMNRNRSFFSHFYEFLLVKISI